MLPDPARAESAKVIIKLDWLMSNGQIGDVMAAQQGFFKEAGLDVEFNPGGPNSATVPPVVSVQATLGQSLESTQLVAARASGVPVKILACGFRTGPYALASLPKAPVRSAADMVGKKIGIQPTARVVIDAVIAKNKLDPSQSPSSTSASTRRRSSAARWMQSAAGLPIRRPCPFLGLIASTC